MEAKSNYTLVGTSVLILLSALIGISLWLSIGFDKKNYITYAVYFNEEISGVTEDSQVKFNGVKVGYVKHISLDHKDPRLVEILLDIEEGTPITDSTIASLITQGIAGTTFIGLSATSPNLKPLTKSPNQPYPIIPTKASLFNQLEYVLKEVSNNIKEVSMEMRRVFDRENASYIKNTLRNLAKVSQEFPAIAEEIKVGFNKISAISTSVQTAGNKITLTMDTSKYVLDQIYEQILPSITNLLRNLNSVSTNIEYTSREIRQNPAIIIRGVKSKAAGPGE